MKSNYHIGNSKKNSTSFNLTLQLIVSDLFHYENVFNYSYKKKLANTYVT